MPELHTNRLIMTTFTVEMMEKIMKNKHTFTERFSLNVHSEWPLLEYRQFFSYKINKFKETPIENKWEGLIIHKKTNTIIGDMGFKGGPNEEGAINIGYSIVPDQRGKGYASEMGKALVQWGLSQPEVKKVLATCSPDNQPSIKVLQKIGLQFSVEKNGKLYWTT
ncbi:GNAT family N-acetyltransferase [Bacillus sp. 1780r2a1]|uniref:GNAT family N-acetyltransferase n=1 Tax=Priestia flexa TaxID=86664 RepID=UPI000C23F4C2|nr:GNAT family N-acetyltransferase [Priestia flexa]MDT2048518.1 GNAT family N-acetyltransferase [Priestia flexa]MDT2048523.1 GNAT family N-acetyltransferase [Priestia flexa]MEC0667514.1 GNAT family N-acetyltransferase [Priestia flexa]USY55419.1 GNAT family N-acetyltransferase [Bacillus sp. 1780r2a1]